MTLIKPQNGLVRCRTCFQPSEGDRKIGERCNRTAWGNKCNGKLALDKRTILGPVHEFESTGNPLLDAARVLELDGWVEGDFVCDQGKKCLSGAVRAAVGTFSGPSLVTQPWAAGYLTGPYYTRVTRASRAMAILAKTIFEDHGSEFGRDLAAGDLLVHETYRDAKIAENIVIDYNDDVISSGKSRIKAIKVLRRAAESWNPRFKINSELVL